MKLKERVMKALEEYPESYRKIDPLIEPLCKLLTNNGYITMHSCSSHVKVAVYTLGMVAIKPELIPEEYRYKKIFHKYKQWYILFVATVSISDIRKIVNKINKKYNYNLKLYKANSINSITRRWVLETWIKDSCTDDDIFEINKNIYLEFKEFFDKGE